MTGLSHVSLVVPDLAQAMKRMQEVYGLTLSPVMVNAEQGVKMAYVELGNARIELIEPQPSNPPLMRFLERHPRGGLHHLALTVDSVEETCQNLQAQGVSPISTPGAKNVHGQSIAFIHPRDFLGSLLELEEARD